ncbi:MAG TPA: glycerol-3-phosphate 1-O-acyltransferase PlsY [Chloroflexota bacterium]|nr:glycerol-3-phosphate 1-O-acyltransferase PlsY [Chloroflexota bacterium]
MTLLLIVGAYLLGSFPSGVVLARFVGAPDVREIGSGNIGAANAARAGGTGLGIAVAVADALKGLVPVVVGRILGVDAVTLALLAVAAVAGHDFSLYLGFRGGKGVATTLGAAIGLSPPAAAGTVLVWVTALFIGGYASLASLLALAVLPAMLGLAGAPPAVVTAAFCLFVLGTAKHAGNIGRLIAGTEPRTRV